MADDRPYADLPLDIMAGNYGPDDKMETAMSAYTPNTPWARIGCSCTVDHNGAGTSSAHLRSPRPLLCGSRNTRFSGEKSSQDGCTWKQPARRSLTRPKRMV